MTEDIRRDALRIIDQHLELERRTRHIARMLADDPAWNEVSSELDALFDVLSDHFELESAGGYMKDVAARLPGRSERFRELHAAHDLLEETLRHIRMTCAERGDKEDVRRLFQLWQTDLREHEEAENGLAEEAFGTRTVV